MTKFCASCGGALGPAARYCGYCGATIPLVGGLTASPAPVTPPQHGSAYYGDPTAGRPRWTIIAGIAAAVVLAGAAGWYLMGPGAFDAGVDEASVEGPEAEIDEDGPLPPEWFANYTDEFLTPEVIRFAIGSARKRNYPTSRGSEELSIVLPGAELTGRFVRGADGESRWLKTDDGGYVWEGNLAEQAADPDEPPYIVPGQSCQGEMCFDYIESGMRSLNAVDLVADIGSDRVVGRLAGGLRVQPLDYRVQVRGYGAATVSCKETTVYSFGETDAEVLQQGTALRLHSYLGEGFVVASRSSDSAADQFQVEEFCLNITRTWDAVDWIRLRLPNGTLGWATNDNFQSVM